MATIQNERDIIISNAPARVVSTNYNYIDLVPSQQFFRIATDGTVLPENISIEAKLFGILEGTVQFTGNNTTISSTSGNTCVINNLDPTADSFSITATLTHLGVDYTATITLSNIRDGATGSTGDSVDIIFKRSATKPTAPENSSTIPTGWVSSVSLLPVDVTKGVWASVGKKPSGNQQYEWGEPYALEGSTFVELTIFKRSLTDISSTAPTGGSYNFTTKQLIPPEGWSTGIPSGTAKVYSSRTTASIYGSTGTAENLTWSTPSLSLQDAVIAVLDTSNHIVSTDEYGAQYVLPTNAIKLYSGGTLQQYPNVSFSGSTSKSGLTLTVNTNTGAITLEGVSWTTDQESFVINAIYGGVTYQTVYTVTKSRAGTGAVVADLTKETAAVFAYNDGTGYSLSDTGNTLSLYKGAAKITSDVTYAVSGLSTKNGLSAVIDENGLITITSISTNSWSTDSTTFSFKATFDEKDYVKEYTLVKSRTGAQGVPGAAGTPAVTLGLKSQQEIITASSDGTEYTYPTGNTLYLYEGNQLVSTGVLYSGGTTKNGLTVSINSTTGAITLSGTSWNTDSETFDLTATYNTVTYTIAYKVVKVKQGSIGVDGAPSVYVDLYSEADVCPSNADGTGYVLPENNAVRVYAGGTEVSDGTLLEFAVVGGVKAYVTDDSSINGISSVATNLSATATSIGLSIVARTGLPGYYYSTDSGLTWTTVTSGYSTFTRLTATPFGIYATNSDNTVYYTTDGVTWLLLYTAAYGNVVGLESNGNNRLAVLSHNGSSGNAVVLTLNTDNTIYGSVIASSVSGSYQGFALVWRNADTLIVHQDTVATIVPIINSTTIGTRTNYSFSLAGTVVKKTIQYAANLNNIVFVTGQMGISFPNNKLYKSTDGGASFAEVTGVVGISDSVHWVSYSKARDKFLIATTTGKIYATGTTANTYAVNTSELILDLSQYTGASGNISPTVLSPGNYFNFIASYKDNVTSNPFISTRVYEGSNIYKDGVAIAIGPTGTISLSAPNNSWISDFLELDFTAKYIPNGQTYTTKYTLAKAKAGNDVTTLILSAGESLVAPAAFGGTGYVLPGASTATLYKGANPVTAGNVVFGISGGTNSSDGLSVYKASNNLVLTIVKASGAMSWSTTPTQTWTSNYESFTITATSGGTTYSAVTSLTKLRSGEASVTAQLLSEADVVFANNLGKAYVFPVANNYLEVYQGGTKVTSGVTYAGTATKNGLTLTISSTGAITLTGTNWTTDQEAFTLTATYNTVTYTKIYTISKSKAGASTVLIDLDRESAQVVANSDGTGYTLPSAATVTLYLGGAALTSGVVYSVLGGTISAGISSITRNGLTCSVNQSTGAVNLTGASWTTNYEEFFIQAVYDNITYKTSYRAYKALKGINGASAITLSLKSEADIIYADAYGGSYIYPPQNKAELLVGGAVVSSGVVYGITGGGTAVSNVSSVTQNGLKFSINIVTGDITYSGALWTTNQESITVTAVYGGNTYTKLYTITKAIAGSSVLLIDLLAETSYSPSQSDGTGYTLPSNNTIRLYLGAELLTSGVTYGIAGGTLSGSNYVKTQNGLTCTVVSTTGAVSFSGSNNSWTTDAEAFDLTATYNSVTYSAKFSAVKIKKGNTGPLGDSTVIAYTKTALTTLSSTPTTITTTGAASLPPDDSWGVGTVWQTTPPAITSGQSVWQSNGIYSQATGAVTWAVPYLSALKVGKLSAISADLGTITAGSITGTSIGIGTDPLVSGTSMSGSGMIINTDGTFAIGNAATNMSFNGSRLTLNGDIVTATNIQQGAVQYINSTYRNNTFLFDSTLNTTSEVVQTVLSLGVYCTGGPILILGAIRSTGVTSGSYRRSSTGTTLWGRSFRFSVMRGYSNSTTQVGDSLAYSQSDSNYVIQAYDPAPPVGFNTYNMQVTQGILPTDTTTVFGGQMLFRSIMIIQVK